MRGRLAPGELDERLGLRRAVPLARSRAEQFDDLVLDAVEQLEERWAGELAGGELAVEDVPTGPFSGAQYDPGVAEGHRLGSWSTGGRWRIGPPIAPSSPTSSSSWSWRRSPSCSG